MKMKHYFLWGKMFSMLLTAGLLSFASCAEGVDDESWSSSVKGEIMKSPGAEELVITKSADESTLTISWPVVEGAGGYLFSLYIVDDPANPVAVGEENEFVDGCSVNRDLKSDTNYKIVVKTLGNDKYDNKDAESATEVAYSTLVPTFASIPPGDIYEYFQANPVPTEKTGEEIAYVLEGGAQYTMSGQVDFGNQFVTFRGDKTKHAKVAMTNDASIVISAGGLKVKFIDFDCSGMDASKSESSFIKFDKELDESIKTSKGYYTIYDPIVIQQCTIKDLPGHLFYDNKKKYVAATGLVDNCIVQTATAANDTKNNGLVYFNQGWINDFTVKNSTFYNTSSTDAKYFVRYGSSARCDRAGFTQNFLSFYNNTFYKIANKGQWGNYNSFAGRNTSYWYMMDNIFLESGKGEVARRYLGGRQNQKTAYFDNNTYWYNGATENYNNYDKSGTVIDADPMLADPANGDFTVGGAEQLARRTGDPRWLP